MNHDGFIFRKVEEIGIVLNEYCFRVIVAILFLKDRVNLVYHMKKGRSLIRS